MKIIIGLGNLGDRYVGTRHNIGFYFAGQIQKKWLLPAFEFNKKLNADISKGNFEKQEIILAKPRTFMNASGEAVRSILDFYKLSPEDIIVIHDDLDIALGEYKIATDSSSAGHKGVQNIIDKIGTQKFTRLRIGIGQNENIPAETYVLQNFTSEEKAKIESISENILEEIKNLLK